MNGASLGFVSMRARSDGTIVEYHSSTHMRQGRVETDVAGKNLADVLPGLLAAALIASIGECLATQSVVIHSYSLEVVDGTCFREACFAPSSRDDEVVAIVRDVTLEHIVDARRVHLAEILEASTDYVATTDLNGRILYANTALRERFGVETVAEGIEASHSLFSFMSRESRAAFLSDGVPELWRTGKWNGEIEGVAADGSLVALSQSAIAHLDAAGNPEYFSGIARDITSVKRVQAELRQSDERLQALLAEGSDVILVLTADGIITYTSPAIVRVMGYEVGELVGTSAFDFVHPDDHALTLAALAAVLGGEHTSDGLQYRVRHANGSWRWTESRTTNHLQTPGLNGFIVNARDITARHVANERIEQASALLASVMGAATNEAIFVTDSDAAIVAFSRGAEVLLGYTAEEVIGVLHPSIFYQAGQVEAAAAALGITPEQLFVNSPRTAQSIVREWVFVRRDGTTFDGALTVSARFDSQGAACGYFYVARDISERRRRDAELTKQALHDTLTGLANRAALHEALVTAMETDDWSEDGRVLLFIDLDHFKAVNDSLGHAVGDAVLVDVSRRLVAHLRPEDLAVRLGGDEFVILLGAHVSPAMADDIANRIVAALALPFEFDGHLISIGASAGLATSRLGVTAEALLLAADGAAYAAKSSGRGRVVAALLDAEPLERRSS